ncbi:undecaprenyldiphospho-muramoylpentapeptide beta-N-acetylglucosaminyltransferase [Planctomicrobium piriforme]|uniref:UDP-N-acetylglucosamine--N-acetylmuramyl-(pentapeptide) pyrophosphoryl-undecaprenol N-acetylglucosamine transferase n=1 Tax=Planctomicrobium piriforme TaxID=1576369 RepID=A0A1I3AYB6_9PLAN|nr:undecaprenyldiphospho-muramoylpentapeptide beta-N-acetylglucosaminyltransferase [Planctomicrobium piriforme]SFH55065.1 UDP-N-acetylglucosamine--N-acetylmuramyl-(pentapeptide) pyrophosphoryl-undecaprenol N-acetylglucosamine transferase [Planctomicrobium piriforme]
MSEWSLVISGGGSGGHLFPALAVVEELRKRPNGPSRVLFLTSQRAIEKTILDPYGVEQIALPAVESHQFRSRPIRSLWNLRAAVSQASATLRSLPRPVVLGAGGYGSIPGGLAAWWMKCPLVLLEQNIVPGRATSLLSRFAQVICTSFENSERHFPERPKIVCTGNPVRADVAGQTKYEPDLDRKILLVLGGSQGAAFLNRSLLRFGQHNGGALEGWSIVHQTGESDCELVRQTYRDLGIAAEVAPFFDDLADRYQAASLVVTRAGGTTLAEIACAGLPAVIVPYLGSLRDHQLRNAQLFVRGGGAMLVEQLGTASDEQDLGFVIQTCLSNLELRRQLSQGIRTFARPDAAEKVAGIVKKFSRTL